MKKPIILLLFLTLAGLMVQAGTKEEIIRLQNDILTVQNQIRSLQKSVDENGAVMRTLLTQMSDILSRTSRMIEEVKQRQDDQARAGDENIEDILTEVRSLGVKIEDLSLKFVTLSKRVEAAQTSIDEMKTRRPKQETGPDGKLLPLPPDQLYSLAYNDYIQGNWELAIQGFLDYLANYKDSELADNAQYYIGDCYFNQGKYQDAVEAFAQTSSLFPKGDKAPSAILKAGLAQLNLNNREAAVNLFTDVIVKYPDSPEANIAIQQLQILGVEPPAKPKRK